MRFYLILLLFVLMACKSDKPGDLIFNEDKLIDLMIDIQLAKAAVYKYPVEERDSINDVYYDQIFSIHKITKYELEHDISRIEKFPKYYKVLLEKVSIELKVLSRNKDLEEKDDN
jgi:hypothetical protein